MTIRMGFDVNKKDNNGVTPIYRAAEKAQTETVRLLLNYGANIDVQVKDINGWTPIHVAAMSGNTDTVKLLLDHGANIHVKDNHGKTPIHRAAWLGHTSTVEQLLDHGANIDEQDNDGDTPIYRAASSGHIDTVKLLLSAGADPHISGYRTVRDLVIRDWSEEWEEKILSSYSSVGNENLSIAAALALNKEDFLMKFIKKVLKKKGKLVDSFLTRDAEDISNLLAFIGKHLTREFGRDTTDQKIKMLIGGEGEKRFYLVKSRALRDETGDRSLLHYIVDNGARMIKQREELLDLLAEKIENVNSKESLEGKDTEQKIIQNLKLGLPSSPGLAECIKMTEEKFKWGTMKAKGMIALSIIINLFSLVLYFLDVFTDFQFVDEMLDNSQKNFTDLQANCFYKFYYKTDIVYQLCEEEIEKFGECLGFHENKTLIGQECREIGPRFEDPHQFTECFIYSSVHCLAPIIWAFLVFTLTMKVTNIPFPPITRVVKISQDTRKFKMRSEYDFKQKVPKIEAEIANYEDSVNLSSAIEAATEAGPQFFFQAVYFLPSLILNLVRFQGWQELVSYKMLSIAFSFTSVAVSNYFIRFYTNLIVTFQTIVYQES